METKRAVIIVSITILVVLGLCFFVVNLRERITGQTVETYLEDLDVVDCIEAGKWNKEHQNYKLTICPDERPIMKGVGIGVTDDAQSGGRAYCCRAENLELYDCSEESYWQEDESDYELTVCPADKPIMKGIGIRIKNNNQGGGKVYCCKGKKVELYSCAVTSYWKKTNKDLKLTYCPEDREIIKGAGFNVYADNQGGGKVYCCKGRVELTSEGEIAIEEIEEVVEEVEEEEIVEEKQEESLGLLMKKIWCKIFHSKSYDECISG